MCRSDSHLARAYQPSDGSSGASSRTLASSRPYTAMLLRCTMRGHPAARLACASTAAPCCYGSRIAGNAVDDRVHAAQAPRSARPDRGCPRAGARHPPRRPRRGADRRGPARVPELRASRVPIYPVPPRTSTFMRTLRPHGRSAGSGIQQVPSQPQRERDEREGGIGLARCGKYGAARHIQVGAPNARGSPASTTLVRTSVPIRVVPTWWPPYAPKRTRSSSSVSPSDSPACQFRWP